VRNLKQPKPLNGLSLEMFSVLQYCAINEPLFPNLETLQLRRVTQLFIPFVPLFLSPRITAIRIEFPESSDPPKAMVASMVATLPKLCPNLRSIDLQYLPRDPVITTAISGMLLASDLDALQLFGVDSPMSVEAYEVIRKLPNLRELSVVIDRDTFLPPLALPNLTGLTIEYGHESVWPQMLHGAILGKLESVAFHPRTQEVGGFLKAFERVALAGSAQNTLSRFYLQVWSSSWIPDYSSLLSFTQLTHLIIEFSCHRGCSSTVDDDVITNLARAMPRLNTLRLGEAPCHELRTGVTVGGLVVLARHCSDLSALCVHFQVAGLCIKPVTSGIASTAGSTALRRVCALTDLEVGKIPIPKDSTLMIALNLCRIFPRINIDRKHTGWEKVADVISLSRAIIEYSGKKHSLSTPRTLVTPPQKPHPRAVVNEETVGRDCALASP